VAASSSCRILTFLWLAYKGGFEVRGCVDEAVGVMTKLERGVPWVSTVRLRPRISWGATRPSAEQEDHLHYGGARAVLHRPVGEDGDRRAAGDRCAGRWQLRHLRWPHPWPRGLVREAAATVVLPC